MRLARPAAALPLLAVVLLLPLGCRQKAPNELVTSRRQVKQQPNSAAAWTALGRAYMQQQIHNDAYIAFHRAFGLDQKDFDALYGMAEACYFLADPQAGLQWIKLALERKPSDAAAIGLRGRLLLASGDIHAAQGDLEKAANLDPSLLDVRLALVNTYYFQNRTDLALGQAEKLVKLFPEEARAHWAYGVLLERKDRPQEAEDQFREALQDDPNMAKAKFSLASLLVRRAKKLQEAERLAREVAGQGPGDGTPQGLAARSLFLQGRHSEALRELARACDQHPRNLQLWRWLHEMAVQMNLKEVAERAEAAIRSMTAPPGAAAGPAEPPPPGKTAG